MAIISSWVATAAVVDVTRAANSQDGYFPKSRLLYQGPVHDLIAQGQRIRLKTDRLNDAFELLVNDQRLSVTRNGDQSLYLQLADEEVPDINALLVQHGFRVMEISAQRESLEEVFLRLTRTARPPDKPLPATLPDKPLAR